MKNNFKIDFIGVGAPKSGTSWAAECLREHPQICFSSKKEINFFNKVHPFYNKNKPWQYPYGMDWYKKFFLNYQKGQIRGEFSPHYLYDPDTPRLIYENFPDVKIIMILRNPIDRLYSHYLHGKASRIKFPSFEEVVKKEKEYVEIGFYYRHIKRYLKYFPKEKILIMIYEDIEKDPLVFIKKIYRFLGVDENFVPPSLHKRINVTAPRLSFTGKCYCVVRRFLVDKLGEKFVESIEKTTINKFRKAAAEKLGKKSEYKYEKISGNLRGELNKIYRPETKKLEKLIGRDLSFWK